MKLAFMTFACPEATFEEVLGFAERFGYDGIEARIDGGHAHGLGVESSKEDRAAARRRAEDAGVEICCVATSLRFIQSDPEAGRQVHAETVERLELAADLGAKGLRVFGGPLPEGVTEDEAVKLAGYGLQGLADEAEEAGVELWLETHDTFSLGRLAGRCVDLADRPAVGINWDVMHPYRNGETLAETLDALGAHIRHTHWHDAKATVGKPEIVPFGEGDLPLKAMLAALWERGFDGYLSGEWFGDQLGATPEAALKHYAEATRALLDA